MGPGKFEHFNYCHGSGDGSHQLVEVFSHWTHHMSKGQFLVCDCQGVVSGTSYMLADPAVFSHDKRFASTGWDGGRDAMWKWMVNHKCSMRCHQSCCKAMPVPLGSGGLGNVVVTLESKRWGCHYLDASTGQVGKGNVYVTEGCFHSDWAKWKLDRISADIYRLGSIRWPMHYLDASTGQPGKGKVFVTKGDKNEIWAKWRIQWLSGDQWRLESVRWPGHFLDASTGQCGKGDVFVTKGNGDDIWCKWRIWQL